MANYNKPFVAGQPQMPQYDSNFQTSQPSGMEYNPTYEPPAPIDIPKIATNVGTGIAAGAMAAGTLTGPAGWLVMGGIQLLGGLLGAFTQRNPPKNAMEQEYEDMISFYRGIGARSKAARAVVSVATGKPYSALSHIGPSDDQMLNMANADNLRNKTAAKVTGGTR